MITEQTIYEIWDSQVGPMSFTLERLIKVSRGDEQQKYRAMKDMVDACTDAFLKTVEYSKKKDSGV